MIDLRRYIAPGAGVWWGQAAAEATPLVDALVDQEVDVGEAFCGLSWRARDLDLLSYGAMGDLRNSSRVDVVPAHYSALPRLFAEGLLPRDVGLVQVAPPGADGCCSLGIGTDYTADAVRHTRVLIAEINRRMPVTRGTPGIPVERFAATIETDRPLPGAPDRAPGDTDAAMAAHVGALVADGDTVQVGVGALPAAILDGLSGHRDLGFHSGILTDGVLDLIDKGVLTGARKEIDPGVAVTGQAMGSADLYGRLDGMPVEFRPASYTHDAAVLSRLRRLVSINSAVEVDLTGQVNGEVAAGRYVGGVGGQADFSGAAARTGSCSVIVLRAGGIVPRLRGVVTTARADVDVVVTEYGAARLRGCPLSERATRLAAVAVPEHREALLRAARKEDR